MLAEMVLASPGGQHLAFEPLPRLYKSLTQRFHRHPNVRILPTALGSLATKALFHDVVSNPGYSGLRRRTYPSSLEKIVPIEVDVLTLDEVLEGKRIDFLKIDVEGGEFDVLQGARRTLREHRPVVVFEFGLGAADHYGVTPDMMYELVGNAGLHLRLLEDWLDPQARPPLSLDAFRGEYVEGRNFYFVASI